MMAHFAQLNDNNVVTQVIVVANEELLFEGVENETQGVIFCRSLFGNDTKWVQTSYNGNIRKHYAGIGFTYDADKDAFIAPQPYASWVLDADLNWTAPVEMPVVEGKFFGWFEPNQEWIEIKPATTPTN
jgi:hypothetical protein